MPLNALRYEIVPYTRGTVLQLGGEKPLYQHFTHSPEGTWEDVAEDAEPVLDALVVMGDVPAGEVPRLWRAVKPGGHLVCHIPGATVIDRKLGDGTASAMAPRLPDWYLDFERPKTACVVRYGGAGDQLMASSILPGLKKQGYHVTVMTIPRGEEILRHDPHIDAWIMQDDGQVPNQELGPYWAHWRKKFDKFIQLSESIEGNLLAVPGRANHSWPVLVRHKHMNTNYVEFTHELAGVPYEPAVAFYENPDETEWAKGIRAAFAPSEFLILWTLSGSSMHKAYPWCDSVMAEVLSKMPRARFILTGDDGCRLLEQGWEEEPRVMLTSGVWSIRQSLAMANHVNLAVGPETGILNSVGYRRDVAKVLLLSHSSKENLSRDWKKTKTLGAHAKIPCAVPCHQMQYTREFCPEHKETGASMCMAAIDPADVTKAIKDFYETWKNK